MRLWFFIWVIRQVPSFPHWWLLCWFKFPFCGWETSQMWYFCWRKSIEFPIVSFQFQWYSNLQVPTLAKYFNMIRVAFIKDQGMSLQILIMFLRGFLSVIRMPGKMTLFPNMIEGWPAPSTSSSCRLWAVIRWMICPKELNLNDRKWVSYLDLKGS